MAGLKSIEDLILETAARSNMSDNAIDDLKRVILAHSSKLEKLGKVGYPARTLEDAQTEEKAKHYEHLIRRFCYHHSIP